MIRVLKINVVHEGGEEVKKEGKGVKRGVS
jgi:hypothetical protein